MEGLSACECPVCFNLLGTEWPPMSMPCGHTLCHPCVEQLSSAGARRAPTFRCPLCREWVNREAVILNVTLRDLIGEGYTFEQSFHHALLLWVLSVCMSSTVSVYPSPVCSSFSVCLFVPASSSPLRFYTLSLASHTLLLAYSLVYQCTAVEE